MKIVAALIDIEDKKKATLTQCLECEKVVNKKAA